MPSAILKGRKSGILKSHSAAGTFAKPSKKSNSKELQSHKQPPAIPYFIPLVYEVLLHAKFNKLPLSLVNLELIEPIHVFKLFMNDLLFEIMAINTDIYIKKRMAEGDSGASQRRWSPITASDSREWFEVLIYMRVCKMTSIEHYWRHDGLWPSHYFTSYISQIQFEQIQHFFHISPQNSPAVSSAGRYLWDQKFDPLLYQLRYATQKYRTLSSNLSVDEAIIHCTSRSCDTYKIKSKPIPKGMKFQIGVDHCYIFNFHPTSNKSGSDPFDEPLDFTNISACILQILKCLLYTNLACNLYMDNFYTNLPWYSELRKMRIGAFSTARTTSKDFPPKLMIPKDHGLPYHFKTGAVKDDVGIIVWIDNKPVSMMTTIH